VEGPVLGSQHALPPHETGPGPLSCEDAVPPKESAVTQKSNEFIAVPEGKPIFTWIGAVGGPVRNVP
jgi:hypothetical protein